ncbi:MAG: glycosyltransferase family 4 protein [Cyanobacteria bacterium]|nr:glycosyltransferase family 4 protein [Cyanobacteriota bacterium]MDA0865010.1 glycosyltransferase family 4 protein [Cyanobacteriota bacterium]
MRVLYSITAYPPSVGGAQVHTHLLAQNIDADAVQVVCHWDQNRSDWFLGTTLKQPPAHNYCIEGVPVHRLGLSLVEKLRILPWLPLYYPLMSVALPAIARVLEPHIYVWAQSVDLIHNVRVGREPLSYASFEIAAQQQIPVVLTPLHHPRWVGWRYRSYVELYRRADAVLALTGSEKRTLMMLGVAESRIHITGIGPVLASAAHPQQCQQRHQVQGPIVLFLGQHYGYKGYRQLLQATALVWHRHPDVAFVFLGPQVKNSYQVFAAYPDPRIHCLGTVDLQTKTDFLAACYTLCVPSSQESFGGVYTEAWNFEKPVIGGMAPAIADVITEGKDGFLVNQDPAEIADRIIYLLDHPLEAAAMGRAGKAKVTANYTWPKIAEKTLRVYAQVCQ